MFSFCVSTPTDPSLDVESFLSHKSLRIVLDAFITTSSNQYLLHLISPQCFTSCVQCSLGSAPFTLHQFLRVVPVHMETLQFIILFSTIVFHHQNIPHSLFSHSPMEGHSSIFQFFATTKSEAINNFVQVALSMISLEYKPSNGMTGTKGRQSFIALWA